MHWPWKLSIGDHCWIGEGAWLLNLEPITIGHDVCISQEALLCNGSHDRCDPALEYDNAPIPAQVCRSEDLHLTSYRRSESDEGSWV